MREELENSNLDLEQLLRTKSWNQLSEAERADVSAVLSGQSEYERMFAMVHQLKTVSGVHDENLIPSTGLRKDLLLAFGEEQKKRRAMWWSGLWFRLSGALRFDIPAVRISIAAVVIIAGIITVTNLMSDTQPAPIAKQENVQPAPEAPKENPATNNNIVVQPDQKGNVVQPTPQNVVAPEQNIQVVPTPVNNGMQVVDGNDPIVQDTNSKVFAMNPVDTNALVVAPITVFTNGMNATFCSPTSNGTVITTNGGTPYNFNWTNTGTNSLSPDVNTGVYTVTVNGLPPRARALSNDAQVLDVFFAVK